MKPMIRAYLLDEEENRFFGEGPFLLLSAVEECGSLRGAAASMGMAYSKALKLLNHAEKAVGKALTQRATGGRDGGGSQLTAEGKELLNCYAEYRTRCEQAGLEIYRQVFGDFR